MDIKAHIASHRCSGVIDAPLRVCLTSGETVRAAADIMKFFRRRKLLDIFPSGPCYAKNVEKWAIISYRLGFRVAERVRRATMTMTNEQLTVVSL